MLMPRQRVVMPQEVLGGTEKNTVEMNNERTNKIGVYIYIYCFMFWTLDIQNVCVCVWKKDCETCNFL